MREAWRFGRESKYNYRGEKEIITVIFPLGGLI